MPTTEQRSAITLDAALKALANPVRREVVLTLLETPGGRVTNCSVFDVPVSKSTLTQHLRVLNESGIVQTTDEGNRCMVELRTDEVDESLPGLLDLLRSSGRTG